MEIARFVATMVIVEETRSVWTVSALPILPGVVGLRLTLIAQAIWMKEPVGTTVVNGSALILIRSLVRVIAKQAMEVVLAGETVTAKGGAWEIQLGAQTPL
ncbi:hypothetical protein ACFL2F_02325 [Myxococcota bacterium]